MNSILTKPKSVEELYRTYFSFANKFEFTSLLRNYIQNEEWKDKSQESMWNIISNISDDIGAVLTDDIVNYTRNVVDVNTCKVSQLIEHAKMLSYNLDGMKNTYQIFPKRIQCLVDVFSINSEYLIGNSKNHVLSDEVIRDILMYIRDNSSYVSFTNDDFIDKLIDNPHSLLDDTQYRNFVQLLFYNCIVEALSMKYSDEDGQPMVFNLLWKEIKNKKNILNRIEEYRSWVDKYIVNEISHPLNEPESGEDALPGTIYDTIQLVRSQKRISSKFNPFIIADEIYFNGMNPANSLSRDELDLVERVLNYHSKVKYDYQNQRFIDETSDDEYSLGSTQYSYYKELEFCEYIKMVMYIVNNLNSFNLNELTYDISSNKFIQYNTNVNALRVVQLFHFKDNDNEELIKRDDGSVVLDVNLIVKVSKFLCDYVFHIQNVRENIKTIAQKHAMRGTGALLSHIVNDYLIKELPNVRDNIYESSSDKVEQIRFGWEVDDSFLNYGNITILEYEDDNEYFNIDPVKDVRYTERTNERYWEQLEDMGDDDSIGAFTKGQIRDFYRNTLGIGRLQPTKPDEYDDICDFLVDLFKIGANPITYDVDSDDFNNPIDDILNKSEEDYGYTKQERIDVQNNTQLRKNQERQFKEYSGNEELITDEMYDLINNRIFYWKNQDYSSHALHPFMYNLKLWNKLNNIIINGYKDYVNNDLIDILSSKTKFDQVFGEFGEGKNFWRYNIQDWSGYTTRYEASIKDEHIDDGFNTISPLTGYDGLFYPKAAKDFLETYESGLDSSGSELVEQFTLPEELFTGDLSVNSTDDEMTIVLKEKYLQEHPFISAVNSIYWQEVSDDSFYLKWYSHLNYTRAEYQKIAMQLWYWRKRIVQLIQTSYPIKKYCLDTQGNSLILVSTFNDDDKTSNPYLIDLAITQNNIEGLSDVYGNNNKNIYVPTCDNMLKVPSEMWIRWKSNPIAIPSLDVYYDKTTGDKMFDLNYRSDNIVEMGQFTHSNNDSNENFKIVIDNWRNRYSNLIPDNKLPVFFDMEQSANVLVLASWNLIYTGIYDNIGNQIVINNTARNPYHIVSVERNGSLLSDYNLVEYGDNSLLNNSKIEQGSEPCGLRWLFDAYHYCPANGSLLIPFYRLDCFDSIQDEEHGGTIEIKDPTNFKQVLKTRMFVIPTQQLKNGNYVTNNRIDELKEVDFDLNGFVKIDDNTKRYVLDYPAKACKNTNVVFSPYVDDNGYNKVKCAFLGCFAFGQDEGSFKIGSCDAKTRYEFDSQCEENLSLMESGYYKGNAETWIIADSTKSEWNKQIQTIESRRYIDEKLANRSFNSYDSMDKYVFVIDFGTSIDNHALFDYSIDNNLSSCSYNILGDAGYIPHFAYQSLIKYDDKDGGISYTWKNSYLKNKNHMQFELLGLDDKDIHDLYTVMQKMVVQDTTDDCKTLVNPAELMRGIFRIWCNVKGVKRRNAEDGEPETYFANEYKDYVIPELDFTDQDVIEINPTTEDDLFELELPSEYDSSESELEAYKKLLDEYYVSVLRTNNGDIQNEKRYVLAQTSLSNFIFQSPDSDGYVKCNINTYQSSHIKDDCFVDTQVIFTGTQDPFTYDELGNKIYSRPCELQYGNGICGISDVELKIDIKTIVDKKGKEHKVLNPTMRITHYMSDKSEEELTLTDRIQLQTKIIQGGQLLLVFSHKNLDNIAKYHILNRTSNLYFGGSLPKSWMDPMAYFDPYIYMNEGDEEPATLPKNSGNQFKYSDFKSSCDVDLIEDQENHWCSKQKDEYGVPLLSFDLDDVQGSVVTDILSQSTVDKIGFPKDGRILPPYYVKFGDDMWYLDQDNMVDSGDYITFKNTDENTQYRTIPTTGSFRWGHRAKSKAESYLDYLYVRNQGLTFKINEESNFLGDSLDIIPPFHIDEVLKNKLQDLNDVQALADYSTFIHQSENPQNVKDCGNFNPMYASAILKFGVLERDSELSRIRESGDVIVCEDQNTMISLDNNSVSTRLALQLEDGEIDDYLKIYTNYVRVDDGNGDFHFDLYFNIQNLLNSPFEYISSVTNQPNVLIIPDSYLYLTGDKYTDGKIDEDKMKSIAQGGVLTIYGQIKTYSNDQLSDVNTIKLFQYRVYNISDDKPKFLIDKIYDITKSTLKNSVVNNVKIEFADIMHTIPQDKFVGTKQDDTNREQEIEETENKKNLTNVEITKLNQDIQELKDKIKKIQDKIKVETDEIEIQKLKAQLSEKEEELESKNIELEEKNTILKKLNSNLVLFKKDKEIAPKHMFKTLATDVIVVQPLKVWYNQLNDDADHKINSMSFDIVNDIIDFGNYPILCDYYIQSKTLMNNKRNHPDEPYYDHWSDNHMSIEKKNENTYRITLNYGDDGGFNFETIYLRWKLPMGFKVMDTMDRLGGYVFSSTAKNITFDCNDISAINDVDVNIGHVVARVPEPGTMYLGLEHSTTKRTNGYVLVGLEDLISNAIKESTIKELVKEV